MATRFYLGSVDGTNDISPTLGLGGGWDNTSSATRRGLYFANKIPASEAMANTSVTIPITTTQNILSVQFVSPPLRSTTFTGPGIASNNDIRLIVRASQSATTDNASLHFVLYVCDSTGTILRGTIRSGATGGGAFAVTGSDATVINNPADFGTFVSQTGDRLVLEVGVNANAPTTSGTAVLRFGTAATSDFAFTSGLTTDLRPWLEISRTLQDSSLYINRGLRPHPFSPGLAR